MAYQYISDQTSKPVCVASDLPEQQSFIDERYTGKVKQGKHNQSLKTGVRNTVSKKRSVLRSAPAEDKPPVLIDESDDDDEPIKPVVNYDSDESDSDREEEVRSKELRAEPVSKRAKTEAHEKRLPIGNVYTPDASSSSLSKHFKKTNTTGKGGERRKKSAERGDEADAKKDSDRVGFLQVRLVGPQKPKAQTKPKVQRKKDGDKNLRFSNCLKK